MAGHNQNKPSTTDVRYMFICSFFSWQSTDSFHLGSLRSHKRKRVCKQCVVKITIYIWNTGGSTHVIPEITLQLHQKKCLANWYLFACALIERWLVSPALLGDDSLQFLWLDPFLLVVRQPTYRCKDSQSINWFLWLIIVVLVNINALAYVDPKLPLSCMRTAASLIAS